MQASRSSKHRLIRVLFAALISALALLAASPTAHGQQIQGVLSNFDAHNENDPAMTNLELDLRLIEPGDVLSWYTGPNAWGGPPIVRDIGGTEVVWADFRNPFLPGEQFHFGLALDPATPAPCGVQAYWTKHVKVVEIPVPWQGWLVEGPQVVDVIRLAEQFPEPVAIVREFATIDFRIPLGQLVWDPPVLPIPWQPAPGAVLAPGESVDLPIEVGPLTRAVLVRYTVALARNPDNVLTRFVNEAEVEPTIFPPAIVGTLSNFDVHNDTGKPVDDLELDLVGILPHQVLEWYSGPDAWGVDPVIRPLPTGPQPGTEVTWLDEWNPLPYCEWRHFGLRLDPSAPLPEVRAHWTRVVKQRQIPVPWQWWQTPVPGVVTDVIQLSDTFDEPVVVVREWATSPIPVPLEELSWDNPTIPWVTDPAGPILLRPGNQAFLDVFPAAGDAAVLVRYTAERAGGSGDLVRFVNEALLDPAAGTPQITGSLSNFDVTNLTNEEYTNLELDLRDVRPWQILDWYRGPQAWGLHPALQAPVVRALPQTEVTWADFGAPLPYCETRHFGIELRPDAPPPCGVQAYWTRHEKQVEIPVPWQTWAPLPEGILDVVALPPDFPEPVVVRREFAALPVRLPLGELRWDVPGIPWMPAPFDPVVLAPGSSAPLEVPVANSDRAVLVRYTVARASSPDDVVTRFVNEAEIDVPPGRQIPAIVGELSNFDVHNGTGKPVHDLELDLLGVAPEDVLEWYAGPDAWGVPPFIRWTPDGLATEVTWVDDRGPIEHCETRHFGLRLRPGVSPEVRAFWTRETKVVQIPVPWQFWLVPDGPFVRDVIQLSDTFVEPVIVRREFAVVSDLVPLDELNWDLAAPWQIDPAGPITLAPGFQADLDIPVGPGDAAVLVRYDVALPSSGAVVTRFVNEAMLGPGLTSGLLFLPDKQAMQWNASPLRSALYDVVRGSLSALRAAGTVADAACLHNDRNAPHASDTQAPPASDGFYYLVRQQDGTGQHGSYDTTADPTLREYRDLEIGPGDCP